MARWPAESKALLEPKWRAARSDAPGAPPARARARTPESCHAAAARALNSRPNRFFPRSAYGGPTSSLKRQRPRRPRDRGAAITKEGRNFTEGRRRDARERFFISIGFLYAGRGDQSRIKSGQGLCRRITTKGVCRCRVYGGVGCLFKWRCGFQSTKGRARPARDTTTKSGFHRRVLTHDARRTAGHELAHGI